MYLQSKIQEDASDVKFIYDLTRGWRIRIALNEPKSLAPKSKLSDGAIPITNTVVSLKISSLATVITVSFRCECQWVTLPN